MNLSLYFINFMYKTRSNDAWNQVCNYITNKYRLTGNENPIGGKEKNNQFLAVGDKIQTCFIEIDKTDLIDFFKRPELGFRVEIKDLVGIGYARVENSSTSSNNITNQERLYNDANNPTWNDTVSYYFLKGANNNDIMQYLVNSKII